MLSYFKINDPYRLLLILFLLLLFRIPLLISGLPITESELAWMILGQKSAEGYRLVEGIWSDAGPFFIFLKGLLHKISGGSRAFMLVLAMLLTFFQAVLFNNLLLRNKAYNQNSYVPALVFMLLANSFYGFMVFSPALLSVTFILLAIDNIFQRIDQKVSDESFLLTGFYLSFAFLSYYPAVLFLISNLLALVFFTGTLLRRYILMITGFLLPVVFYALYLFWHDQLFDYLSSLAFYVTKQEGLASIGAQNLLFVFGFYLFYFVRSLSSVYSKPRFVNYQVRFQQVMIFLLIMAWLVLWVAVEKGTFIFYLMVPSVAFFIAHFFLILEKKRWRFIYFYLFFFASLGGSYAFTLNWFQIREDTGLHAELVKAEPTTPDWLQSKRLWVLDSNRHWYLNNPAASPYFDWQVSHRHFDEINYYDQIQGIYLNLMNDPPEVVLDKQGAFAKLINTLPEMENLYRKGFDYKGYQVYIRRSPGEKEE